MEAVAERVWGRIGLSSLLLAPFSVLYAAGWLAYRSVYDLGLKRATHVNAPVLTIGNLAVGGSGKTPFVLWLVSELESRGTPCAVLMSGYGSPSSQGARIAPEGPLAAGQFGDEPAMARWAQPELKLAIGRDRVRAARLAATQWPGTLLVLDDGFQHLPLHQDITVVLDPIRKNRLCFPAGPYREPRRSGCQRAGLVLPNSEFQILAGQTTFMDADRQPVQTSGAVQVLTAIARPQRLLQSLTERGLAIHNSIVLPDHHPLDTHNLLDSFDHTTPIVVTSKDWVKLRDRDDIGPYTVHIADYLVSASPSPEFLDRLLRRIHEAAP